MNSEMSAQSCPTLCSPVDCSPSGSPSVEFTRQKYSSGLPFLSQRIFLTQRILQLLHWQTNSSFHCLTHETQKNRPLWASVCSLVCVFTGIWYISWYSKISRTDCISKGKQIHLSYYLKLNALIIIFKLLMYFP